jgi:3-methyladenine DNA glycosylase AlkC
MMAMKASVLFSRALEFQVRESRSSGTLKILYSIFQPCSHLIDINYSSLVIDDLHSRMVSENSFCVAYLYCDYRDVENQTPANMLAALLKQALSTLNESYSLPTELAHSLKARLKSQSSTRLELKEICQFLVQAVIQFTMFYICIDALDEYQEKDLGLLLQCLENTSKGCSGESSVRIFVTGRPRLHWEQQIRRHTGLGNQVNISLEANPEDIRKYVLHEIENDEYSDCMNDSLETDILVKIVNSSDGM